jgi:hypothetical protein
LNRSKSELRSRQLNIGLTEGELQRIKRRAENLGMRPVHFGRAALLEASGVRQSTGESNFDRLVHDQLSRLGNNLNQMVRYLHRTGDPIPADIEPLLSEIRQILSRRGRR